MDNSNLETFAEALMFSNNYKNKDGSYNKLKESTVEYDYGQVIQEPQVQTPAPFPMMGQGMTMDQYNNDYSGIDRSLKKPQSINELLIFALSSKAADVHLSAGAPPKYRMMNELRAMPEYGVLTPEELRALIVPIMKEEQLAQFEQDGEIDFSYYIKGIGRFRVNCFKQRGAISAVFRILADKIPTPQELGIPEAVRNLIDKKHGLILVTGPTGSGKTTTLASLINEINKKYKKNIITLEDPIEYIHNHIQSNVNQREIGYDTKSFASALRSALREDPDVILVGEMRDFETISIAITAAETGHLVLSTLHTMGAAQTIDRILDTYPTEMQNQARSQLAGVIEGIISQHLVPKQDGSGRLAVFEVMLGNTAVRNLIREKNTEQLPATIQICQQEGMCLLDDQLINYVRQGVITPDTALNFANNAKAVQEHIFGGR